MSTITFHQPRATSLTPHMGQEGDVQGWVETIPWRSSIDAIKHHQLTSTLATELSPWVIWELISHQSNASRPQASHLQAFQAWLILFERRVITKQICQELVSSKYRKNSPLSPISRIYFCLQWDIFVVFFNHIEDRKYLG